MTKRFDRKSSGPNAPRYKPGHLIAPVAWGLLYSLALISNARSFQHSGEADLAVTINQKYGQLEIGSKYAGAEFHDSRPLPTRVSFYYPVANSIDLSTSYWKRDESRPFAVILNHDGKTDTLGAVPSSYEYTPYNASFSERDDDYGVEFSYSFCEDLPLMVFEIELQNPSNKPADYEVLTGLQTSLRTSHTFALKNKASFGYRNAGSLALTRFDDIDTDSTVVFVANVGAVPLPQETVPGDSAMKATTDPCAHFRYRRTVKPGERMLITQLIGTCRQSEQMALISRATAGWEENVRRNEDRIQKYVDDQASFVVNDSVLQKTALWSKAMIASDRHYIDGRILPMPCPAEYNFFFTHDFLVTGLAVMRFDTDWVKQGYQFLESLTQPDSILPHAYYWKDSSFVTEFCQSDNWNHLWLIHSVSSYLKHSGDIETVARLYPVIHKSLRMMLSNKGPDDLMYATRPDWWDIGNVYGARTYITALMSRVLQDYVFISQILGKEDKQLAAYLRLSARLKERLVHKLWSDKTGYLMNMLDDSTMDGHYYSGSLIATHFDLLVEGKRKRLLQTAETQLLDRQLGIRNAMPADFHRLIELYKFNGMEAGEPYFYFNGGIWPQGIAWYALGLLRNGQPDQAEDVLKRYLTLDGISNSPNGQPAMFEYRISDPASSRYGEIDKPTFLWAGGWYLYTLYELCGVRENAWNISFNPNLPRDIADLQYDLTTGGKLCRVRWLGKGTYFSNIVVDGKKTHSAILTSSVSEIALERGIPDEPYLAASDCFVRNVSYFRGSEEALTVLLSGLKDQTGSVQIVSPGLPRRILLNGLPASEEMIAKEESEAYTIKCSFAFQTTENTIEFIF